MEPTTIHIKGMTCEHCVKAVTQAIQSVPGVQSASVSLEAGTAHIVRDPGQATFKRIQEAVEEEGYEAEP